MLSVHLLGLGDWLGAAREIYHRGRPHGRQETRQEGPASTALPCRGNSDHPALLEIGQCHSPKHFVDQGFQRNYTIQDAIHVLERGQVSGEAPEWNDKASRWGYRVHGPDLEGDVLTVVVSVGPDPNQVWLVTAF